MILQCGCGKKWFLKDEYVKPGLQVPCKQCNNLITVSAPAPAPDASKREQELNSRIQALERGQAANQEALREKEKELDQAQARIAELETRSAAADEVRQLQQQIRQAVAERESLAAEFGKFKADHSRDLEAARGEATQLAQLHEERTREVDGARRELVDRETKIRMVESKSTELEERIRGLEKELADVRLRATEAERERKDLESALEEWRGRFAALEKKSAEAAADEQTQRLVLGKAVSERDSLLQEKQRKQGELGVVADGLKAEVLRLQEQLSTVESKLRESEAARSSLEDVESRIGEAVAILTRTRQEPPKAPPPPSPPEESVLEEVEELEAVPHQGRTYEPTPVTGLPAVQDPAAEEPPPAEAPAEERHDPIPLIEGAAETPEPPPPAPEPQPAEEDAQKKKGFFSRLFGKKQP